MSDNLHVSSGTNGFIDKLNVRTQHMQDRPNLLLTSHLPGGLPHDFTSKKKGQGLSALFSNQHPKVNNRSFISSCLLNSRSFPHQLLITVLGHPSCSKIDTLSSKKTSKASVNEMFNVCYGSYVSLTSNLWAWGGTFIMYDVYIFITSEDPHIINRGRDGWPSL